MKFFFADGNDAIDPKYDFNKDVARRDRDRTVEDVYAHDILKSAPYDGILVSRATFDRGSGVTRHPQAQRFLALIRGIHSIYHLDEESPFFQRNKIKLPIMGDCGAFTYISRGLSPYGIDDTISFYSDYGFDLGLSPDRVITDYNLAWDDDRIRPADVTARAEYTCSSAIEFLKKCRAQQVSFEPIGIVQSWSPRSASKYAQCLIAAGYSYIALGGLAYRPTIDVYNTISEVCSNWPRTVKLHILGFSRIDCLDIFNGFPVESFDSSSPLIKAFKDGKANYYSPSKGKHYRAIKLPSRDESKLKRRIACGELDSIKVKEIDEKTITTLREYGQHRETLETTLKTLQEHDQYLLGHSRNIPMYQRLLTDRPWEKCTCAMCQELGIEIAFFRGLNRNKRRGYHNLFVFYNSLRKVMSTKYLEVPCMKVKQSQTKEIFIFVINGKDLCKFTTVSRIMRTEDGDLTGYQRPEIYDHITEIREYLEREDSMLPNSIIVAFNQKISFSSTQIMNDFTEFGTMKIELDGEKHALIVDGQQRTAAFRMMKRESFPVSVVAFESTTPDMEREQFVLVNNTRPLPKSLVYELLPSIGSAIPSRLKKRQFAYAIMIKMSSVEGAPFYRRILTATSGNNALANIKDISVLKMIEHSFSGGILQNRTGREKESIGILNSFWSAVRKKYADIWMLPPRQSRLTHGAGIVSMGYLMDAMGYVLESRSLPLNEENFYNELSLFEDLPWTKGEWIFSSEHIVPWNELQNTSRHIDMLSNYLIRLYKTYRERKEYGK